MQDISYWQKSFHRVSRFFALKFSSGNLTSLQKYHKKIKDYIMSHIKYNVQHISRIYSEISFESQF